MATKLLPIFEALQGQHHGQAVLDLQRDGKEISLLKEDRLLRLGHVGTKDGFERWGDQEIGSYLVSSSLDPKGKPGVCYGQTPDTDGGTYEFHFKKDGHRQNNGAHMKPEEAEGVLRPLLIGARVLRSDVGLELWRLWRTWREQPSNADFFAARLAQWQHDIQHGQNLGKITPRFLDRV